MIFTDAPRSSASTLGSHKHLFYLTQVYVVGLPLSIFFEICPTAAGWLQTNVNLSTSFVFGAICLSLSASLLLLFFGKTRIPYSP
jgi:hypothetical protein